MPLDHRQPVSDHPFDRVEARNARVSSVCACQNHQVSKRRYEDPPPASADQVAAALAAHASCEQLSGLLVGAALNDPDWRGVQDLCLAWTQEGHEGLAPLAITCLGHLARLHGDLDLDRVLPVLAQAKAEAGLRRHVEDALDDIHMFITVPLSPWDTRRG